MQGVGRHPRGPAGLLSLIAAVSCLMLLGDGARSADSDHKIVLIGGPKSHGVGEHDFSNGVAVLKELLDSSPDAHGVTVAAFPDGWPMDSRALEGASSLVLYFDGLRVGTNLSPLSSAAHREQFVKLMKQGVGVVALHQASTLPVNETTFDLPRWLGGARYGMADRTIEPVLFKPATHPISNGVGEFLLNDEFYPTIRFVKSPRVTPILIGRLHPQFRDGKFRVIDQAEIHPVAWAFERDDGGRAFTFTGLHYLEGLDNPPLRKLLLNAIFWTAKIEVPKDGVRTRAPTDAATQVVQRELALTETPARTIDHGVITRAANDQVIQYPWGQLTWYVSRELKNSDTMTVGEAIIKPGQENPRHFHPNCDEVLHVLKGHIVQTMGNESVEMNAGDTVNIPAGIHHNAKNIGTEDAVLAISYSSADRQAVGE